MLREQTGEVWISAIQVKTSPRELVARVSWSLRRLLWFPSCGSPVNLNENVGPCQTAAPRGQRRNDHLHLSRVGRQPDSYYFQLQGQGLCMDQVSMCRVGQGRGRGAAWRTMCCRCESQQSRAHRRQLLIAGSGVLNCHPQAGLPVTSAQVFSLGLLFSMVTKFRQKII